MNFLYAHCFFDGLALGADLVLELVCELAQLVVVLALFIQLELQLAGLAVVLGGALLRVGVAS
jgi:hypothetical protein